MAYTAARRGVIKTFWFYFESSGFPSCLYGLWLGLIISRREVQTTGKTSLA